MQTVYFESKQEAYTRFKDQFKDSVIADSVTPDQMPESFRVKAVRPAEVRRRRQRVPGRAGGRQRARPAQGAGEPVQRARQGDLGRRRVRHRHGGLGGAAGRDHGPVVGVQQTPGDRHHAAGRRLEPG
ncbi:hypothetical protein GCM10025868_12120 [Angustibacter aerolatus]|uniref:FtsX extracellular domain-containing protein n=1 Tax=Angustibacter aerolatus TaxID=1162965 RepID=A0ABQ6JCQ6_9ACTN|nr:hypothetical protein GCM10025868_12120 [Angustibacter aerolatus]